MTLGDLVPCVVTAGVLILFGLVPGLFQKLTEAVRNFSDMLLSPFPSRPRSYEQARKPNWGLAGFGMAAIVAMVLAYVVVK